MEPSTGPDDSPTRPRSRATRGARPLVGAIALGVVVVVGAAAALAGSCRVLVALGAVDMEPSPAGMAMRISGSWEFDNVVQVSSGLSFNVLLVRQDNFVRLHYPNQSFSGSVAGLADHLDAGLTGDDILDVEAAGTSEPSARFVSVEAQRMKLSSPMIAGEGPISVLAYLVLDGDYVAPILSNTVTRPLEDTPPTANSEPPSQDVPGEGEPAP